MVHTKIDGSSNILAISYGLKEQKLIVKFKGDNVYCYDRIPESVWEDFCKADSKGKFMHANVIGKYDCWNMTTVIEQYQKGPKRNATEILMGFTAWLTSRKQKTIMSSTDDAAPIVRLVDRFIKANNLPDVTDKYPTNVDIPYEEEENAGTEQNNQSK